MEGILTTFGIDARLIVIQIINFGLLAVALWYFLYTPILKMLNDREEKIKKGVEDAENAQKALSSADDEKKTIISAAHKDAEDVSVRAKEHADKKSQSLAEEAQEKAAQIVQAAEVKSAEIKEQAHKESEAEITKVAILAAEKVLQEKNS